MAAIYVLLVVLLALTVDKISGGISNGLITQIALAKDLNELRLLWGNPLFHQDGFLFVTDSIRRGRIGKAVESLQQRREGTISHQQQSVQTWVG